MKFATLGLAAFVAASMPAACLANDLKADQRFTESTVAFDLKGQYSNFTLTITGPNDFSTREFSRSSVPSIDLRRLGALADGVYIYQLSAATDEKIKVSPPPDNNGREGRPTIEILKGAAMSGSFLLTKGVITTREASQPRTRARK